MNSDFKDLLRAFSEEGVRYLVVGGYAFAEHVEPRYTKDLDVWIERSADNGKTWTPDVFQGKWTKK